MAKAKKDIKKNKTSFDIFVEHLYALNNSKFFAGIIMLIMNIGSKYISLELSKSQEDYVKYKLVVKFLFSPFMDGNTDIIVALILTCIRCICRLFSTIIVNIAFYQININLISQLDKDEDGKISQNK